MGEKKSEVDENFKRLIELDNLVKAKANEVEGVENKINII